MPCTLLTLLARPFTVSPQHPSEKNTLTIPKLLRPSYRPTLLGALEETVRSAVILIRSPKSFTVGILSVLVLVNGGRFLLHQASSRSRVAKVSEPTEQSSTQATKEIDPRTTHRASRYTSTIASVDTDTESAKEWPEVVVQVAQSVTVEDTLTLNGTVIPENLIQVSPDLSGLKITEMRAQPGDRIVAGQVIAVLDNSLLFARRAQAEDRLAQAETAIRRHNAMQAQAEVVDPFAATILGSAQANIDNQLAEIADVDARLAQTVVIAPISGTVAKQFATVGEVASTNSPIYSLIESNALAVEVYPSPTQLSQIELGMPVSIRISDTSDLSTQTVKAVQNTQKGSAHTVVNGSVLSINTALSPGDRQATVKVALSTESSQHLRAGMSLQADIITSHVKSVVVPATALVTGPSGESVVYTVSNSSSGATTVQANPVEVAGG